MCTREDTKAAPDLIITTQVGETVSIDALRGKIIVIAFISHASCHTGHALELIDGIMLENGSSQISAIGCIVDLPRGESLKGDFSLFQAIVGAAPRRKVAEFLNLSMSGFYLPQFLVLDGTGRQRLLCTTRGSDYWEAVHNFRESIQHILDEPLAGVHANEPPSQLKEMRS